MTSIPAASPLREEFRSRTRETITPANGGFVYGFSDAKLGLSGVYFAVSVVFDKLERYTYDEKTKVLTLYGSMVFDVYERDKLDSTKECKEISLLNVFDIDLLELLEKNGCRRENVQGVM